MIQCTHRIDETCQIGNKFLEHFNLAGIILCADDAHNACTDCKCPHKLNYVSGSLTYKYLRETKQITESIKVVLVQIIQGGKNCIENGPGSMLAKILHYLKIEKKAYCSCDITMQKMNAWGSERCIDNIQELTEDLHKSSIEYGWSWFSPQVAATLIRLACQLANGENWLKILARIPVSLIKG